jgi:hypothetical protein
MLISDKENYIKNPKVKDSCPRSNKEMLKS